MTDHPLTDEKLKKLFWDHAVNTGWDEYDWTSDGMRAAYDLAVEHMSQWIEENGYEYVAYDDYYGCQSNFSQMITDFKKAMCPQGMVELDQSNKEDNQ